MATLSPFRYPGGKGRLLSQIVPHVKAMLTPDSGYLEPFVGGGSVALALAPRTNMTLVDLDPRIAAFWRCVVGNSYRFQQLLDRVAACPADDVTEHARMRMDSDLAFQALYLNRCSFSGILDSGPIGGYTQASRWKVDCRYNAPRLVATVRRCRELLKDAEVLQANALDVLAIDRPTYVDPPYVHKGAELYAHTVDHSALARVLKARDRWVLSYDDCEEVRDMYAGYEIIALRASYTVGVKKSRKTELLILSGRR